MISTTQIVSQVEGNIVSDMDGEKVMLSIASGKYYNLGEMGGLIWEEMKEGITVFELVSKLTSQFDITNQECEKQVVAFLTQLLEEDLIQVEETVNR